MGNKNNKIKQKQTNHNRTKQPKKRKETKKRHKKCYRDAETQMFTHIGIP